MASEFTSAWQAHGHLAANIGPLIADDWAKIARQMAKRVNGVVASKKNDCCVPWRNSAERDLMHLLEVDTNVVSYEAVPERVDFVIDGIPRHHLPAVRVVTEQAVVMMDVFRDTGPGARERAEIARVMREVYAEQGIHYRALSPTEVRLQPRLGNAIHVLGYRGRRIQPDEQLQIMEVLSRRGGSVTIAELQGALGEVANTAFPMAIRRTVRIDLSAAETSQMRVSLRAGGAF